MAEDTDNLLLGPRAFERAAQLRADANDIEEAAVYAALEETQGSESRAAALLGISRDTLHAMLRRRLPSLANFARQLRTASGGHAGGGNPNLRKAATPGPK
jgi:DNA-binding NtrC family response regulator